MWNYVNHKLINFSFQFSSKLVAIGAKLFFTNKSFNVFQSIFLSLSREKPMKFNLIYHFVQQIFSLSINSTILLIFWSFTSYLILKYATFVADKTEFNFRHLPGKIEILFVTFFVIEQFAVHLWVFVYRFCGAFLYKNAKMLFLTCDLLGFSIGKIVMLRFGFMDHLAEFFVAIIWLDWRCWDLWVNMYEKGQLKENLAWIFSRNSDLRIHKFYWPWLYNAFLKENLLQNFKSLLWHQKQLKNFVTQFQVNFAKSFP